MNKNFSIPKQIIKTPDGSEFQIRDAMVSDVEPVTVLIRKAFKYWTDNGVDVSPARQSSESTQRHLVGKGFVVLDSSGVIVATFSLDEGRVEITDNNIIQFYEGSDSPYPYKSFVARKFSKNNFPLLVFKKLAVDPVLGKKGLGGLLYNIAENYARTHQYSAVVLETVKEAKWLYDWYVGLGYETVGGYTYPGSSLETLLLIKDLCSETK